MNKKRNDELIQKAEIALNNPNVKIVNKNRITINESFNGQIAAFGVSVGMVGIRPAIAIYNDDTENCKRTEILNAIAVMLGYQTENIPYKKLSYLIFNCAEDELKKYRSQVLDCANALKQVIRTYNLVKS